MSQQYKPEPLRNIQARHLRHDPKSQPWARVRILTAIGRLTPGDHVIADLDGFRLFWGSVWLGSDVDRPHGCEHASPDTTVAEAPLQAAH